MKGPEGEGIEIEVPLGVALVGRIDARSEKIWRWWRAEAYMRFSVR